MENKNAKKIWKKIKPFTDSIDSFMQLILMNSKSNEDYARLYNLERAFTRGIVYAESKKYVNEKKPLITKEGWRMVIDGYAIEECLRKILIEKIKKLKKLDPEIKTANETEIINEAKDWSNLGIHPKIHEAAIKSYNKGIAICMSELAKLCKDQSLDFDAPAKQFIKKIFKNIFG